MKHNKLIKKSKEEYDFDCEEKCEARILNALRKAITTGNIDLFNLLLELRYCDPNEKFCIIDDEENEKLEDHLFEEPLIYHVVGSGNLEILKILLHFHPNLDVISSNGFTPLHLATIRGDFNIVELLLTYGADVTKPFYNENLEIKVDKIAFDYKHYDLSAYLSECIEQEEKSNIVDANTGCILL